MGLLDHSDVYWEFAGQCTQCGDCTDACTSLTSAGMTLGEIAKAMLKAERGATSTEELYKRIASNPQLMQAVRGCFFCTSCENTCFAHNDVCKLIYSARVDFQNLGIIPRDTWTDVQVDQEWDIFTAYRAIHGINFTDLTRHVATEGHTAATDCEVAFFPGCSMAAYGPELTREIFTAIEELGGKATMVDACCGSPLRSAGFYDRAEALCDNIASGLESSGAKKLVCVCPGCANEMKATLKRNGSDIETVSLSKFLAEHDFAAKRELPDTPLCLTKACQDRDGIYLEETCDVLGIDPGTPTVMKGCCGAGGAVNAFDPNSQTQQAESKLDPVSDGSTLISMCPTCTYTYAYYLMGNPRDINNKHYAELLFEHQFDWDTVFSQLGGMWTGEYGEWLAHVFA